MTYKNENELQRAILDYLLSLEDSTPIVSCRTGVFKGRVKGGYVNTGRNGWPDITCLYSGKPVAIEVKLDGKQEPDQVEMQKKIEAAGGYYIVARSVDDVKELLKKITRGA